ncbi:MAG TPA: PilN domain-containing protein [Actinomycetota bacterium]|nr:PilN domain-containing protein [Actinomycetota bacterium]
MTQVNLLPREVQQRQRTRRRTAMIATLGAVVVGAIVAFWFLQGVRLHKLDDQVAAQEATNAQLQTQVTSLQKYADQKSAADQQKALLQSALVNTVEWSNVLDTVSKIEPNSMWLTSMSGNVNPPAAAAVPGTTPAPATGGPVLIGTITFQGNSLDTDTIATWLTKLETVKGWVNSWFGSAQVASVGETPVWSFNSSVDLEQSAALGGSGGGGA